MATYNVDVVVTDPVLQDVSVIVSESSAGVLLGGLNRYVLTKNSDADNDASWKEPGGFTFTQDTTPTPTKVGDTFFDTSTGVTGGCAYVAIDNGSGGLIWVQFAPGSQPSVGWTPYTPVVTASTTNPNIGTTGTAIGSWTEANGMVFWRVRIVAAGTGITAGSGTYFLSLPPKVPNPGDQITGSGWMYGVLGFKNMILDGVSPCRMIMADGNVVSNTQGFQSGSVLEASGWYCI